MQLVFVSRWRRRLIGLTSLIDVVFILLLFFMLASQFHHWRALTVQATGTSGDAGAAPSMLVRVRADGTLDLNGEPTSPSDLSARLRQALAREPELWVQVESADEVPLQTLVTLLDQLHAAGIERMSLR